MRRFLFYRLARFLCSILTFTLIVSSRVAPTYAQKPCYLQLQTIRLEAAKVTALPPENMYREWTRTYKSPAYRSIQLFDTTVYIETRTQIDEVRPGIDKNAKAIVIGLSGNGTKATTGRLFVREAMSLGKYGISAISFDYPFSGQGPTDKTYLNLDKSRNLIRNVVKYYRQTGKPVYLVGHSHGTLMIQDLLFENPNLADGAIYFSPAGLTPDMETYYRNLLAQLSLDPLKIDLEESPLGMLWGDSVSSQSASTHGAQQKTARPVLMVAGDQDHWSTPELITDAVSNYANASVTILPGVDHTSIHNVMGKKERVFTETIVDFISRTQAREFPYRPAPVSHINKAKYYARESRLFRAWVGFKKISLQTFFRSEARAEGLIAEFLDYVHKDVWRQVSELVTTQIPIGENDSNWIRAGKLTQGPFDKLNSADHDFLIHFLADHLN